MCLLGFWVVENYLVNLKTHAKQFGNFFSLISKSRFCVFNISKTSMIFFLRASKMSCLIIMCDLFYKKYQKVFNQFLLLQFKLFEQSMFMSFICNYIKLNPKFFSYFNLKITFSESWTCVNTYIIIYSLFFCFFSLKFDYKRFYILI